MNSIASNDRMILDDEKIETLCLPNNSETIKLITEEVGFKIFHLNIRSIRRNFDELCVLLENFEKTFDAIVLSEAFICDLSLSYHIPGYTYLQKTAKTTRNEGIVIFYRNSFDCKIISEADSIAHCTALCIELKSQSTNQSISILGIYRTPSISDTTPFTSSLDSFLTHASNKPILVSDININIQETVNTPNADEYLTTLSCHGYIQCINTYTRVTENTNTLIDHIFIPNHLYIPKSQQSL